MSDHSALNPPTPELLEPGDVRNWKITKEWGVRYGCYWVRNHGGQDDVDGFETGWFRPGIPRDHIAKALREARHHYRSFP